MWEIQGAELAAPRGTAAVVKQPWVAGYLPADVGRHNASCTETHARADEYLSACQDRQQGGLATQCVYVHAFKAKHGIELVAGVPPHLASLGKRGGCED